MNAMPKLTSVMVLDCGARSDVGRVRDNNEDSFRVAVELGLFILSDGMGGLEAGEIASKLAVDTVFAHCRDAAANPGLAYEAELVDGASDTSNRLASAIEMANRMVRAASEAMNGTEADGKGGMGATVVALQFFAGRASIAHVGDSRAYRLRSGEFAQLTDDHSLVAEQVRAGRMTEAEAEASPLKSILMRALGVEPSIEVEVDEELALDGDTYLLCSDGLTRELSDAQIAAVLGETSDAQHTADRLVNLANQAGGGDNITAVVVRVGGKPSSALGKIGRWIKGS